MIQSVKKTILTGATTVAILGSTFAPISGAEAAPYHNIKNKIVKVYNQENFQNHDMNSYNHHYYHLRSYTQAQIKQYELRFKQLGYNIYDQYSIKNFQKHYHLQADGILGRATITKLMMLTYSQYEVDLLARTIYMQSYNQPFNAQIGVGAVILNRLQHSHFPNTVHGVIQNDRYFKQVTFGRYADMTPDARYYRAAYKAIQGVDPTRKALHVQNKSFNIATSSISISETGVVTYGQTVFTR
ncbi:cell wall hydrolase [Peribacillus huizhouensis]|uniref:Spore germination cell wall hydrolase CwlJ-like protein n=1 Tax=Peribacillus huizhouensis TaxID=1501239 RepID=A0ABR6CQG0_9BACI|nr:cell wall hydrolase [Peribacillus huizhouensis]MBA9027200.1 spore germination cell wall hydrolase CwlJ-like protein [Peribacillus huizhouensis]